MGNKKIMLLLPDETVMHKIYMVNGKKVMIDRDLAELYGVETKRLKETVRRNRARFPPDFMFEMGVEDFRNWRTQIATSNSDKKGLRYAPFCFTEQGVTMLSCILKSSKAIAVNIQILRVFNKMREVLYSQKDILLQIEKIERRLSVHDEDIQVIFKYLKQLLNPPATPRRRIGFRRKGEED